MSDSDEDAGLDPGLAAQRTRRAGARSRARVSSSPTSVVDAFALLTSLVPELGLVLPGLSEALPANAEPGRDPERTRCASTSLRTPGARRRMVVAIALSSSGAAPCEVRKA